MSNNRPLTLGSILTCLGKPVVEISSLHSLDFKMYVLDVCDNIWTITPAFELLTAPGRKSKVAKVFRKFEFTDFALSPRVHHSLSLQKMRHSIVIGSPSCCSLKSIIQRSRRRQNLCKRE